MSAESPGQRQRQGFRAFFSNALRPKKSRQVLRKANASTPDLRTTAFSHSTESIPPVPAIPGKGRYYGDAPPVPSLTPLQAHQEKYRAKNANIDTQLGENLDYTTVLHSLGVHEVGENDPDELDLENARRPPGEPLIASLSVALWTMIAEHLNPAERACLAFTSKTLFNRLGPGAWIELDHPDNLEYRGDFLVSQDRMLPHHLLCFPCGKYHRRTREGREKLQPANVLNPLFACPNAMNTALPQPRHRITQGRAL
ncbi:Superoxide dismutase [Mn], mitochondrial, partial [Elasticomyces elasticus]